MEPQSTLPAEPESAQPAEAPAAPTTEAPKPTNGAVMDVVAPPPPDKTEASATPAEGAEADPNTNQVPTPAAPPKPVTPKPPRSGSVTLAIIATIIIVLGLAGLATYAFLQSR